MNNHQFNQRLQEIATNRTLGASELARRCLAILADSASASPIETPTELREQLMAQTARLVAIRPSMAPIQNLLNQWQRGLEAIPLHDLEAARRFAQETALALSRESERAVSKIAKHATGLLGPGKTLMTHSLSSTVIAICQRLKDHGLRVILTESRPLCEGRRLARQLSAWAVPTTYITDAQIGLFVDQADAVIVGADSLLEDGSIINKAGTYLLALAARDRKVPFYACCESFKCPGKNGPMPKLEEMAIAELQIPGWPHVTPRNIYFEMTPATLISGWITEKGFTPRWRK
jgi:translation initiation factor eIF-2B subunit delta